MIPHLKLVLWICIPLVCVLIGYVVYLIWSAWTEVAGAPREDMFMCQKHGFISPRHVITFAEPMDIGTGKFDKFGKELTERKAVQYCPLCFHANMKAAENVQR